MKFLSEVYLQQKVFFNVSKAREYNLYDNNKDLIVELIEEKKYNFWQWFFKSKKPFNMEFIIDNNKFKFIKRSNLISDMLGIFDSKNNLIFYIEKRFLRDIKIYDGAKQCMYSLNASTMKKSFEIIDNNSKQIAKITKKAPNIKEFFSDADTFHIIFPADFRIEEKIALIGISIFIDSLYFDD